MSEPFMVTRGSVTKQQNSRGGQLFDGTELTFGVRGEVKTYYRLEAEPDLPLPVDYMVVATGG